jgi:hypothetical protein
MTSGNNEAKTGGKNETRLPYNAPGLTVYGDLRAVTKASKIGTNADGLHKPNTKT